MESHMIDLTSEFGRKAKRHIETETVIWLVTVDANLVPQPRPVWFIWDDNSFLIFSKPTSYKLRHIAANPMVSLHFNTDETGDDDVVVFSGTAAVQTDMPPADRVLPYVEKYRAAMAHLDMTPEQFSAEYSVAVRVKPTSLRGW
jgi:PPOX class probable F420-dependent enzyme